MKKVFEDFQKRNILGGQEEGQGSGKKEEPDVISEPKDAQENLKLKQKVEEGGQVPSKKMKKLLDRFGKESSMRKLEVGESSKMRYEHEAEILWQKQEKGDDASKKKKKLFSPLRIGSSKRMKEVGESSSPKDEQEESSEQKKASKSKMSRFLGRFKRGSSKKKQEEGESSKPKEVPEDGVDEDHPHGFDEFRNYLARYNIAYPNEELHPDSSPNVLILSHPIYLKEKFEWQDILTKTQSRSLENLLTQGAYGQLYRCVFSATNSVAVKFQDQVNPDAHQEFIADLNTLQTADHGNIVKLLGTSFGRDGVALIYDFMPRGALDQHLLRLSPGLGFGAAVQVLNWEMRMHIAVGVAAALAYLHNALKVIHRDVKIEDVLLDQAFNPRLANFDLAVEIQTDEEGNEIDWEITPYKGTPGCLAPETESSGTISTKCDVYGYGILLFQLFTGMKALDFSRTEAARKLTDLMARVWTGGEYVPQMLDANLRKRYSVQGLESIYEVARMCTDQERSNRPDMATVVEMVVDAAAEDVQEFPGLTEAMKNILSDD